MPRTRRNGATFDEFCCECCKHSLLHVMIGLVVTGFIILIVWLAVRPKGVKFYVTDASLTQFDYYNNTLHYNLALNITIDNHHNKKIGIDYEYIEAQTLFQDARFDLETLEPFYQGHENTTVLSHVFKGQQLLALSADQASELDKEKSKGVYEIQVKLYLKARFKYGGEKKDKEKDEVTCDLQVPLTSSSNNGTSSFQTTKCKGDLSYGYEDIHP